MPGLEFTGIIDSYYRKVKTAYFFIVALLLIILFAVAQDKI